jgi:hypothetical protein
MYIIILKLFGSTSGVKVKFFNVKVSFMGYNFTFCFLISINAGEVRYTRGL